VRLGYLAAALGGIVLILLIAWFGSRTIGIEVLHAGWAIPANTIVHLFQLFLSACAWRLAVGDRSLSRRSFFRLRVIREGVNSLLPAAQIGGQLVAVRLMMKAGIRGAVAGAGTTLDITLEAAMQLVFTLAGIGVLAGFDTNHSWASWVGGGLITGAIGIVGFVVAQRAGLLRVIEWLALNLQRVWPALSVDSLRGLHRELMKLQRDWRTLARASAWHFISWSLGTAEVYLTMLALGVPVGMAAAFVIESLGMAARSAGFVVPGALGVQEGGFILACGLFGVPPEAAIALSMVKRLREILVGLPGLALWHWAELNRDRASERNGGMRNFPQRSQ